MDLDDWPVKDFGSFFNCVCFKTCTERKVSDVERL